MSNHRLVHVELSSRDRADSARFYEEAFGWKIQEFPEMDYTTWDAAGGLGGGFNPISEHVPAGSIVVYIHTDDLDDSLNKVQALGGSVVMPRLSVPGVGDMAWFKDLSGNVMALLQPAAPM